MSKQLADLRIGEWFDRKDLLEMWVVTDLRPTYDDHTVCVRPTTGQGKEISNSEVVYPRESPIR